MTDDTHEQLIHALLEQAVRPRPEEDSKRVTTLLTAIRNDPAPRTPRAGRSWKRHAMWVSPVAALVFIWLTWPLLVEQRAYAAVDRTLAAENSPVVRQYNIVNQRRTLRGRRRLRETTLYVRGPRFALRTDALLGEGELWLGGDREHRWIVPAAGPVLTGPDGMIRQWSRRRRAVETPFLRTAAILKRLKQHYDLTIETATTLGTMPDDAATVVCDHVIGVRRKQAAELRIPDRIELWADRRIGFARRVELEWTDHPDSAGLRRSSIVLVDLPQVPADWFEHQGHHDGTRPVIRSEMKPEEQDQSQLRTPQESAPRTSAPRST